MVGGAGNDTLLGDYLALDDQDGINTPGNDTLTGGAGDDTLDGGAGSDLAVFSGARSNYSVTQLSAGVVRLTDLRGGSPDGVDDVSNVESFQFSDGTFSQGQLLGATSGNDSLVGTSGNDVLDGLAGADTLAGLAGDDTLSGGTGDDVLDGGGHTLNGYNVLNGDAGADTADYSTQTGKVYADLAQSVGYIDAGSGFVFSDSLNSIENLTGGSGDDVLFGDMGANVIRAGAGDDQLFGGAGDDLLIGGTHGAGNFDQLNGGAGFDTGDFSDKSAKIYADLRFNVAFADPGTGYVVDALLNSIENLTGGSGNDILFGEAGVNVLNGGAGDDLIFAQDGDDTVIGGGHTPGGYDVLFGENGTDTASFLGETGGVFALLNAGPGLGAAYVDNGSGYVFNELLFDFENLMGGSGNDVFYGNQFNNVLNGAAGNDVILGQGGDDTIIGGLGDDSLYGEGGNDSFVMDAGLDIATGGIGADSFSWALANQGADVISDFSHAQGDRILLDHTGFGVAANLVLTLGTNFFIGAGAAPTSAVASVYFDTTSNILWFDGDGTGSAQGANAITFLSNGAPGLSAGDILFT